MGSWHLILFPPQLFWLKAAWKARRLVKSRVANLPDPLLGCGRLAARPRQEQGGLSARPTPWLWAACSQTSPGAGWPQPDPLLWLWAACSQTSPGAGWLRARPTPWLWAACSQTPVRSRVASEPDPLLDCGRLAARPRSGAGWPQSQTHSLISGGLRRSQTPVRRRTASEAGAKMHVAQRHV